MSKPLDPTAPLPVYTLLRNHDVGRALECLRSFHEFCRDHFRHVIIDDGTLTAEDGERLREALNPVEIVGREESEDRVGPRLRGRPNCLEYRKSHPLAIKLIDSGLLAEGAFAQLDSDVRILRPFSGLDRREVGGEDFVCMKDFKTAYSVSYFNRHFGSSKLPLPQSVNSGLLFAGPGVFDLDFLEWFLGREEYRGAAWVREQTAYAAMAGRTRPYYFSTDQVAFPWRNAPFHEEWVALHFISPIRDRLDDPSLLEDFSRRASTRASKVETLRTVPADFPGPVRDFGERLYNRMRPKV